ncbi:MAG TPA: TetR/AcrR family transcriptional regulator [Myxococcaceae bacterium]|nr:TetR/AcrR family transcriptional regulator [Myxococcaceae bacterium]
MPRVSPAHAAARRRQILDAAWACFARKGFHGTTMPEICREAGLSTGAVYSYFPSKEELIEEGARRALASSLDTLGELGPGAPAAEAVAELLVFFVLWLAEPARRRLVRSDVALWGEAATNRRLARVLGRSFRGLRSRLTTLVRRAQTEGAVPPGLEASAVARAVLALYLGIALQSVVDPGFEPRAYAAVMRALRFDGGAHRRPRPARSEPVEE